MQGKYNDLMTFEYHFRFNKLFQDYFCLSSIGWERWKYPQKYSIDNKDSSKRQFVFQYTVSGEGAIAINSHIYTLKPGQAFLIERPSNVHYFLPRGSTHWELKFVCFNAACHSVLKNIMAEYGNILTISESSSVMKYWEELYKISVDNEMDNFFEASAYSYKFMMHLHDTLRKSLCSHRSNNSVQTCMDIIHANYRAQLTLNQLADLCNMSPSYLSKIFKETFQITPINYLIKYRIEIASNMLLHDNLRIEDIAVQTGFNNANYFSRMFKQIMGVSPKDYRKERYLETNNSKEAQQLIVRYEMIE